MSASTHVVTAMLRCLQCNRASGTATELPDRLVFAATDPAHAEAVRKLRCPSCPGGRLWAEDVETTRRPVVTRAEWLAPVRPGRPRKEAVS